MLSLKLIDLRGLENMRRTTLEAQLQVVGVSSEGGGGFMPREVLDAEAEKRRAREGRALAKAIAADRDRQVRLNSVARDLELGLPISIQQPDGEEYPRKSPMQLRSYDQRNEIVKGFIQGPPNKTISNSSDWGSGSSLDAKGRPASKSNSYSSLLPGQQQQPLLNFLKPSSSSSVSSGGASGGKSSPPSRSAKSHGQSRPSSSPKSLPSSKTSKDSKGGSPSVSTHSSLTTIPTATVQPHKPSFTEKLQSMFSDKSSGANNNQAPSGGSFAARLSDEAKSKSSKSSKVKGQTTTFGKLKGDIKKFSNLPPTEAQVYMSQVVANPEISGKNGAERNRMGLEFQSDRSDRLGLTFQSNVPDRIPPGFVPDRLLSPFSDRIGSENSAPSDRNGNERERAYSDSSMVRKDRSFPEDLSQSRMSLCYEGEDAASTEPAWSERDLPTELQGPPSNSSPRRGLQELKCEQDPTSFLYQHIQPNPNYCSSMNVSQTPPPPANP